MKLRSPLLFLAGIGVGYSLATKMRQDDPDVVHGPRRQQDAQAGPTLRLVSGGAQRIAIKQACSASMRSGEHEERSAPG